ITVTDANGCQVILNFVITSNPLPVVNFIADVFEGCEPLEVEFTNIGDMGISCEWNLGDGTTSTLCGPISHVYENDGIYDVTLKVTNPGGCFTVLTLNDYITVHPNPTANFIYNPFNPSTLDTEVNFVDYSEGGDSWE